MSEKDDPKIKDIFKISEIDELNTDNMFSKKIMKELQKKYGKVSIPFFGIVFEDTKKFLFLMRKNPDPTIDAGVVALHTPDITKDELQEILNLIAKGK